jgi:hypothetical protein
MLREPAQATAWGAGRTNSLQQLRIVWIKQPQAKARQPALGIGQDSCGNAAPAGVTSAVKPLLLIPWTGKQTCLPLPHLSTPIAWQVSAITPEH